MPNTIQIRDKDGNALYPISDSTLIMEGLGTVHDAISGISGKEETSNKVTSISSLSTDTQYPSAKCVYDIIGDIETLLAAI